MLERKVASRSRVRRVPARATYDRALIHAVLDEGYVCHVGIAQGPDVFVLPMAYVRIGDSVFVHGSNGSRLMRRLADGTPVCITVTHLDGLVLARSAFHHSMNYRSAVIFGVPRAVPADRKVEILDALMDRIAPGRKHAIRPPTEDELVQTLVVEIPIEDASAKIRSGPPVDDEDDLALDVWAGVIPFVTTRGTPIPDAPAKEA